MNKVARVALFRDVSPTQYRAAMYNLEHRMMPIIRQSPGFLFGVWTANATHTGGISFTLAPDPAAAQALGVAINSAPLLEGQIAEDIPQPAVVHNCAVFGEIDHQRTPSAARLAYNGVNDDESTLERDTRWLFDEFMPFIAGLPGLTQAYMLLDVETRQRLSMTFWENAGAIHQADQAVMAWSQGQVAQGRQPAFRPEQVITDETILFVERGSVTA